ncbi:MAG: glycogen debranching protein [Desulfobacteraceae bacterium IS3]|nr:MAG: glycogen debranching protein [Desulfobacteraceae bacterium IS3]
MKNSDRLIQTPNPGTRLLMFRGDTVTFTLSVPSDEKGTAWLRTNIGNAKTARLEIIREVLYDDPPLRRDWSDIPMILISHSSLLTSHFSLLTSHFFQVTLPLCEVGHFEAKCYFLRDGESDPVWPPGQNTVINTEPADFCCANIIYNAFVRQFGPNKRGEAETGPDQAAFIQNLDKAGYTVIPKSGTFRDLIKELDFIVVELGCRILQLLPVHPTPTTYGRMGRFGSPYATLSFTEVDPALAEFDPRATPLEQFIELVDAVHEREAKIFIDIAINHTGWAARLHETHPEWLVRGEDGRIEVPGAWGVKWEDLTKLDYSHRSLWQYMADVFLTWCRRGVDGFRCDAGYMIPVPAWKYIVAEVRDQYPDTFFLLEGLGGKISVTRDILNTANFDAAYSELFQNYDRSQIEYYLPGALEIAQSDGLLIHFAETHDNNRMAARSKTYSKMRTALCALCSRHGGFGFANGVEWFAPEKINVHESRSLNWGAASNQVPYIRRLNTLLQYHPAFHDRTELKFVHQGGGNCIALFRHHKPTEKKLLIVVNLDDERQTLCEIREPEFGTRNSFFDLLSEKEIFIAERLSASEFRILLEPGQVFCLSADNNCLFGNTEIRRGLPPRISDQCLIAKALEVFVYCKKEVRGIPLTPNPEPRTPNLNLFDLNQAKAFLAETPLEYCRSLNSFGEESRVISWQWSRDIRREVMIPPGYFLLIQASTIFSARITDKDQTLAQEKSLPAADGSYFALFLPLPVPREHRSCKLKMKVYTPGHCEHADAALLFLSYSEDIEIKQIFRRPELLGNPSLMLLSTNGRGGMLRANASWGKLNSRYDALLAANLNPDFPEDRWIMFTRCRAWLVFQGYSSEICNDCIEMFRVEKGIGYWEYHVPAGQSEYVCLSIEMEMIPDENAMRIVFRREHSGTCRRSIRFRRRVPVGRNDRILDDAKTVRLILRPDIEDRNFHETTKAYSGPEHNWPGLVESLSDGFDFAPSRHRRLRIRISSGTFTREPEWHYMVYRPLEAERGLDSNSDLFSPGYFSIPLGGGDSTELTAEIGVRGQSEVRGLLSPRTPNPEPRIELLRHSLDAFVVKRDALNTVIAGYPWFLDWGRDTLIFVRGLIASGRTQESRAILTQFARFEKDGTLPNMIRGNDAGNRDTSDAPLWFFVTCSELIRAEGNDDFLNIECNGRTIREILVSMALSLIAGTPNGIRMDKESGLLFSPSHFTWMDTNFPAGTPREGYPIEIQAMWHFALSFLESVHPAPRTPNPEPFISLASQVRASIMKLFFLEKEGYLSDCLYARPGTPASQAEADDALRPNQLFALTLNAVTDKKICRSILAACEELLVPGAIRSLADRSLRRPLGIYHYGRLLSDPHQPYQGIYAGDEDTRRKPAYHNGTAWTWVFPSFCEAYFMTYKSLPAKQTAAAWLGSSSRIISDGCVGHIPEISDGDFPHTSRGCDAQAWGISEWLRVWLKLTSD